MYKANPEPNKHTILALLSACIFVLGIFIIIGLLTEKPLKIYHLKDRSENAISTRPPEQETKKETPTKKEVIKNHIAPPESPFEVEVKKLAYEIQVNRPAIKTVGESLTSSINMLGEVQFEIDDIIEADQLDAAPRLLPPYPNYTWPKALQESGINAGKIEVVLLINQMGLANIESIVSSDHAALAQLANKIITRARFSPPLLLGEPVIARYVWPLELRAP